MNDNDSDDGTNIDKIKEEPSEQVTQPMGRPGPKSKKKVLVTNNSELMLTADKAMKKELSLLNGPVSFNNDAYIPSKDSITKKKQVVYYSIYVYSILPVGNDKYFLHLST